MLESDLTTVDVVALELGVSVSDNRLARLVSVASDAIRRVINRARIHYGATIVESVKGYGRQRIILNVTPVVAIDSVVLGDGSTVDASEYAVENSETGIIFRLVRWPYTGLAAGMFYDQPAMGTEESSIVVTYEGGWITPAQAASVGWAGPARNLPYDLEQVAVETVVSLYRRGGADNTIASESFGSYSVSYRSPSSSTMGGGIIPDTSMPALAKYIRHEG